MDSFDPVTRQGVAITNLFWFDACEQRPASSGSCAALLETAHAPEK